MRQLQKFDSYLGYLGETNNAKWIGRTKKYLTANTKVDGEIMERRDFVLKAVLEGFYPEVENIDSKTLYWLHNIDEGELYKMKKTEYDFAHYLIDCGFTNADYVSNWLTKEEADRKVAAKEEADRIMKEVEEKTKAAKNYEICRNAAEKMVTEYSNKERLELARQIFEHELGLVNVPELRFDSQSKHLLVCIENVDNPYCRDELISILHTGNIASRKIFEHVTGLKLPKSNKETTAFLKLVSVADYGEMKQYKPRKKPQSKNENLEIFYIAIPQGESTTYQAVQGEYLKKYDLRLFIHKGTGNTYNISSAECGYKLCYGKTKTDAMNALKRLVDRNGVDYIKRQIQEVCEKRGYSPWVDDQIKKQRHYD